MNNTPSWFNPEEYSKFLAESVDLFEMNIPYQKQKVENRKKLFQFRASKARQEGLLKQELARDLYRQKAKGIQMGLGEEFKQKMMNNFFDKLMEASNPLKSEKRKMRPEVDPADRERDRKRESRRDKRLSGLADILIVRNKKIAKIEIITTEDFNSETHEVIKGRVGSKDKGPVAKSDLISASKKAEFMNTKTSMRLLGKVSKEEDNKKKEKSSSSKEVKAPEATMLPPPAPRAPKDGKEITDELSTFPDWDHQTNDLIAGIAFGLNQKQKMPPEIMQKLSVSRTLADSVNRSINELLVNSPNLTGMNFQFLPATVKSGNLWSKLTKTPQTAPTATIIGTSNKEKIGISIKVGQQIRPGNKGESGKVLELLMNTQVGEKIIETFSLLLKDYFKEVREVFMTKTPISYKDDKNTNDGRATILKMKKEKQEFQDNKNIFKNRGKQLIEDLLNIDEDLKAAFVLESISGNIKFDGKIGSANMMISVNKDGSNSKLIPLEQNFINDLCKSKETYLSTKFVENLNSPSSFDSIFQQQVQSYNSPVYAVSEIEKIQELANPINFMQFFGIELVDVVYVLPIDYSDYYDVTSDKDTILILNPNSKEEKELRIAVQRTHDISGAEENIIEKGADHMLEQYCMINDYLVNLVNNSELPTEKALDYIREEFDFLTERNYRQEYDNYHSKPEQRANRSKRVLARRKMEDKGRVHKGDGKDVDHKDGNPQNNGDDNLRVLSKSKNRSMNEDHGAGFDGTSELLQKYIKDTPGATETSVLFGSRPYSESKMKKKKK